jgi:hypothetical protein
MGVWAVPDRVSQWLLEFASGFVIVDDDPLATPDVDLSQLGAVAALAQPCWSERRHSCGGPGWPTVACG